MIGMDSDCFSNPQIEAAATLAIPFLFWLEATQREKGAAPGATAPFGFRGELPGARNPALWVHWLNWERPKSGGATPLRRFGRAGRFLSIVESLWHYRAYGLHWACDFELPELAPWSDATAVGAAGQSAAPDVSIVTGATLERAEVERAGRENATIGWGERQSWLLFAMARFTVSEGARILVEPVEGYGSSSWRVPLLGSVLALLLEQRGLFALHAGALEFGEAAAAFVGDKGQGKSTLNASLSRAGFPLLCDDVVALQAPDASPTARDSSPLALPGFSQIKLEPSAVRAVTGADPRDWPAVAPELLAQGQLDKRSYQAPLAKRALPLRALFILRWAPTKNETDAASDNALGDTAPNERAKDEDASGGNGVALRRLGAQEALAQLIPHTFGARFGAEYLQGERRRQHFLSCARLASACAVWELTRPRDLTLLPAIVERVARAMEESAREASQF